ncbi:MAG: hypothetical protein ACT4ON_12725 [Bacteroidota bacterium]
MENIVISINNKREADFLVQLAKKLGFNPLLVSDDKKRLLAREKIIQLAEAIEKNDISEDEIQREIDKLRQKRNEKKK